MTLRSSESPGPRSAVAWSEFRPGAFSREETDRTEFRDAVAQALGVAAGLGNSLRITWSTGRRSRVLVGTAGHRSSVWFQRILSPTYPPGRWSATVRRTGATERGQPLRAVASGLSLPEAADQRAGARWTDAVWPALAHLPTGLSVAWTVAALAAPRPNDPAPRPPPIESKGIPVGFRLAPLTRTERELRDELDAHPLRARWRVHGEIVGTGPAIAVTALARLLRTSSGSSRLGRLEVRSARLVSRLASGLLAGDDEVASLLPPPWATLPWAVARDERMDGRSIPLGVGASGVDVGLPWPAVEGRHLTLLGESGMGKSTLLVRLGLEAARRHAAVVVLDPIGDTADAFLRQLGPRALARTTLIAPESMPLAINALAPSEVREPSSSHLERTLNDVVTALRRVRAQRYPETPFWGPRIEETVLRALSAASLWPGGTIAVAEALLDPRSRGRSVAPPEARASVDELRAWVADRPEEVEGSRRLLGEVTRNRWLRRMLCEPAPRWQVGRAVEPGAVTVVSGEASAVGESTARYLLAVYLALLWPAILARRDPAKVVVLADEVQLFAHESLAEMLRLGRRYNVHLWAATQSLEALPEGVGEAIRTNSADLVLFRGSPAEAREIERWNPSVIASELLALPRGWSIVLVGKGERVETIATAPLHPTSTPGLFSDWLHTRRLDLASATEASSEEVPDPPGLDASEGRDSPSGETMTLETLLELFAVGLAAVPPGEERRVSLQRLRATIGVADSVVRRTGSELQRLGLLRGSGRDGEGAYWRVARDGAGSELPIPSDPEYARRLRALWSKLHDE